MKLTFEGWQRVVMVHTHELLPVKKEFGSWWPNEKRKSITWTDGKTAYAKVEGLELTGNFLVRMDFTEAELRSWLAQAFDEDPERTQALVASAQAKAIRKLARSSAGSRK